ncbi:MAG: 3-hydroxyacyl-CoA dehydrogenase NAD-binding domain-containing protein [Kiloniellales bacterium]|nr:3-hydroxyacyl-CoA dehydrogenase NAD-binding domain-containing protein [Kiloniellales bacterium]
MAGPVTTERRGSIAVITVDNPPVNALSQAVRQGLDEAVAAAQADGAVAALVIAGAGRTFIAGADIREFGKPPQPPSLPEVISRIEAGEKPVIVALHGTALGGGLEVALGCHYRVALPGAKVGLPEVLLGLIPGAGGTQRTPRLIGAEKALDLITSGRHVAAEEALALGLIDEISEGEDPVAAGIAFAEKVLAEGRPARRSGEVEDKIADDRDNAAVFEDARKSLEKKARGLFSPFKCVAAVEAAVSLPFAEGLKRERALFLECMDSPQRAGLIHAFFAEREVRKIPESKAAPREIAATGVIGGGTMGAGIAVSLLTAGLPVTLVERDEESLTRGRAKVEGILDGGVKRGKMTTEARDALLATKFATALDYGALTGADLVIEAVFEDMAVKKQVFQQLDAALKPGAILASNTSYLNIDEIAAVTGRPKDVIGLHFFSPAHVMKLLEVVVAGKTAPEVVASGFALAKRLGKVGVRAGVCDGFIGNRILSVYRRQADYMIEDGASPYAIDAALLHFGFPMGPYAVADLAGLDIGWANRKRLAPTRDPQERYVEIADRICERGWFGQKTGRGYYLYKEGSRKGEPDPEVEAIIAEERAKKGMAPRDFTEEEIVRRYLAAMVNEGAKVVEEGIALRPLDVDVTLLYGYGFPRWRGGPMKYADMTGLDKVLADIRGYEAEDSRSWKPAQLLVDLVERGETFDSLNRNN